MKNNPISSDQIHGLLKQSFLNLDLDNPQNHKIMNSVAQSVLSQKPFYFQFSSPMKIFIGLIISLSVGFSFFKYSKNENNLKQNSHDFIIIQDSIKTEEIKNFNNSENRIDSIYKLNTLPVYLTKIELPESIEIQMKKIHLDFNKKTPEIKLEKKQAYVFPNLNEEDRKETLKQKEKMLKSLLKRDKKVFSFIPGGVYSKNSDGPLEIEPFYMQTTEVSNLEYRTYLFDLLMQNRQQEFLESKPDQNQWIYEFGEGSSPYKDHYFSHPAYNNYPVVNISRKGAENYCKWLFDEIEKIDSRKSKIQFTKIRLPKEKEWEYAASAGGAQFPYPWGGPYVRNSKGCFLANFKLELGENKCEDCDTVYENAKTTAGSVLGEYDVTAPVASYIPNSFGLYCMSGNVAEMVIYGDGTPGTKGGSWQSTSQELQINGNDRLIGITAPSTEIGFRPIIDFFDGELDSQ